MSLATRIADGVSSHSRTVLVVLLLTTAFIGTGMSMVDDDSSLEQFESDSPEGEALEDIDEAFGADDQENTTSVQLITRGDGNGENVLRQASLIESLEFQQQIKANESINETLVDDEPITGVENFVALAAITEDEADELEAEGDELEAREQALENQTDELERGIDESVAIQREVERVTLQYDETDPEYQEELEVLEAEFDAVIEDATEDLDEDQADEYEELAQQARAIESDRFAIELQTDQPEADPEYQELSEQLEDVYTAATVGVLEDEFEQLEDDAEALEEESEALMDPEDDRPSLDEQIEALEDRDEDDFETLVEETLDDEDNDTAALGFMPSDYDPGSTEADARMTFVTQDVGDADLEAGAVDDEVLDTQLDLRDLAADHEHDQLVFGVGVITDEIDRSMADSLIIVGPLALAFVVAALLIAYRDPLDIVLGVAGIITVLVWTFGFMGWTGIAFNQMMIAIPVLLIGLSIDYAIHVFMRHREHRGTRHDSAERAGREGPDTDRSVRGAMTIALAGVGVALVWVTATTAIGFLANLISPIAPIQEFGVVAAFGILSALLIFGGLIPAAKVELDSMLEARGVDRRKRAFGTGENRFSDALSLGAVAARKAPLIVLVAALVLTAGGVYGASQVDTSFEEEDFLAESPPAWTEHLPGPMSPGEYQASEDIDYVNENFQREDAQAQILVEGDVADGDVMETVDTAGDEAGDSHVVYTMPDGEPDIEGPLEVMETTAAQNESFNESFSDADTTGDGVPDENVAELYDELFEIDEDRASSVIYRTDDGEYTAVRLIIGTEGDAPFDEATDEMRTIAATIDSGGTGDDRTIDVALDRDDEAAVSAIATGDPIVSHIVEQDLLDTVLESLLITLVAVFVFLTAAYWLTGNSATLGAVTLLPVALATSWILGTMYLIGMPFNVLTGMITSLTIGLGVAYSIHVSARYMLELQRQGNVWEAMQTTVTGTGGALLGSAATTVGGFGTLALAILPVLRQFGIITALTITYAFLASVVVLPTLLVLWTRYLGPDVSFAPSQTPSQTPAASDGGQPEPEDTTSRGGTGDDE